ncbi:Uncharacterized protein QTN25_007679 [Entamoeba marina]
MNQLLHTFQQNILKKENFYHLLHHLHILISFYPLKKSIKLTYFQVAFTDSLIMQDVVIPFTRIETMKVVFTNNCLKFFDGYTLPLALTAAIQLPKEEITQVLSKVVSYYPPFQKTQTYKILQNILSVVVISTLFSTNEMMSTLTKHLLLRHSPEYCFTVFNPPVIYFKTLQCSQTKEITTPSLSELRRIDPDLIVYPTQRLVLIIYNPRIVKQQPLSLNVKRIPHITATINSYKKRNFTRPQRYVTYDFMLNDKQLEAYIH